MTTKNFTNSQNSFQKKKIQDENNQVVHSSLFKQSANTLKIKLKVRTDSNFHIMVVAKSDWTVGELVTHIENVYNQIRNTQRAQKEQIMEKQKQHLSNKSLGTHNKQFFQQKKHSQPSFMITSISKGPFHVSQKEIVSQVFQTNQQINVSIKQKYKPEQYTNQKKQNNKKQKRQLQKNRQNFNNKTIITRSSKFFTSSSQLSQYYDQQSFLPSNSIHFQESSLNLTDKEKQKNVSQSQNSNQILQKASQVQTKRRTKSLARIYQRQMQKSKKINANIPKIEDKDENKEQQNQQTKVEAKAKKHYLLRQIQQKNNQKKHYSRVQIKPNMFHIQKQKAQTNQNKRVQRTQKSQIKHTPSLITLQELKIKNIQPISLQKGQQLLQFNKSLNLRQKLNREQIQKNLIKNQTQRFKKNQQAIEAKIDEVEIDIQSKRQKKQNKKLQKKKTQFLRPIFSETQIQKFKKQLKKSRLQRMINQPVNKNLIQKKKSCTYKAQQVQNKQNDDQNQDKQTPNSQKSKKSQKDSLLSNSQSYEKNRNCSSHLKQYSVQKCDSQKQNIKKGNIKVQENSKQKEVNNMQLGDVRQTNNMQQEKEEEIPKITNKENKNIEDIFSI